MDVNLTISLMRGQMGVVIEKAVNAAVETVLGEMIRVVSLKFEQLRREMSLKDKENHDIKKMLETSRCQMKILRQKYITALNAKDYRQPLPRGPAAQPPGPRRAPAPSDSTSAPGLTATPGPSAPRPAPKAHTGSQQESVPAAESCTHSAAHSNQDLQRAKNHAGLKVETSSLPGVCEPHWAQNSQAPTEAEHTDSLDLNLLPVVHTNEVLNTTVADGSECFIKVKQEEPEVEIFEVKQELVEPSTSESCRMELHHQVAESRNSIELPGTYQSVQTPGPSVTEPPAFLGMDQSAFLEVQPNTSASTMDNFWEDYIFLKEENHHLKEENWLLKEERKFIRDKSLVPAKTHFSTSPKVPHKRSLMESSDSSASVSETDSSFDVGKRKKKNKKKAPVAFGKRVQNPEDVVHRYRAVLKEFKRTRSMTRSCESLNVDRNTIALTAVIAEVVIATEGEIFGPAPVFNEEETLSAYAKTCKAFLDHNQFLGEKIQKMKSESELLPIKYKFRK